MANRFFNKKSKSKDAATHKNRNYFTGTFKRDKVYSSFQDNICDPNLEDMQLIRKYNRGMKFVLCFIDSYSKYAGCSIER